MYITRPQIVDSIQWGGGNPSHCLLRGSSVSRAYDDHQDPITNKPVIKTHIPKTDIFCLLITFSFPFWCKGLSISRHQIWCAQAIVVQRMHACARKMPSCSRNKEIDNNQKETTVKAYRGVWESPDALRCRNFFFFILHGKWCTTVVGNCEFAYTWHGRSFKQYAKKLRFLKENAVVLWTVLTSIYFYRV